MTTITTSTMPTTSSTTINTQSKNENNNENYENDNNKKIKIILFYQYFPKHVVDFLNTNNDKYDDLYNFQKEICNELNILGRVLVSKQGINGTLSGTIHNIDQYIQRMKTYYIIIMMDNTNMTTATSKTTLFANVDWKSSFGNKDQDEPFPDLAIRKVKELVASDGMNYDVNNKGGQHLTPSEFHQMLEQADDNLIMLDVRNRFEYAIGHFEDSKERKAMDPNMRNFTQFKHYIKENKSVLKGKKILMYCTGGIRCETASAYLNDIVNDGDDDGSKNNDDQSSDNNKQTTKSSEIYQLQGGIHRYCEEYPDGYFKGKNFVFDRRMTMDTNTKAVGTCSECGIECDVFHSGIVCTVCVCLVLVCKTCQTNGRPSLDNNNNNNNNDLTTQKHTPPRRYEWYCKEHTYLSGNYFTFINIYNINELKRQRHELLKILNKIIQNDTANNSRHKEEEEESKNNKKNNIFEIIEKEIKIQLPNGEIKIKKVKQKKINQKLKNKKKNEDPFQRELTIKRQIKLIDDRIKYLVTEVEETGKAMNELIDTLPLPCRSCKKFNCNDGKCWGFWQSPSSSTSTT